MTFTHLHLHSHYSLLDGLPKIDELISQAKKLGMKALALTDHGVMYGLIEFYQKAKEANIKPILGCEIYLAPHGMTQKRTKIDSRPYHLVLLCKNNEGYKNLIKIVTAAHLVGYYYRPRVDFEFLKNHHQGLIALTSCLEGEIPRLVLSGKLEKAAKRAKEYEEVFGQGNFYLEIQHHPNIPEQKIANEGMITISKKYKIPCVATCDSHYLLPSDAEIQDILLCVQTQKKVNDKDRLSMLGEDFSLKGPKEMAEIFKDIPEAISNTEKIAQMCNVELELGKIKLPKFPLPPGHTPMSYLKELTFRGLAKKYGIKVDKNGKLQQKENKLTTQVLNRLEYELKIIEKTGFAPYLLIVQDFVNWAKQNKIVVGPGRGSAAGSLICYLLNITEVDPLKYDLLFERFLNPERISMPDIDLDFADTRRDEVIEYVRKKYGQDRVAQIITFGKMAARAAVRDVVRVLGYPYSFGDQIAKLIPMHMSISEACEKIPELKELYQKNPDAKKILEYAKKLEGVARHASVHACGVVIAPDSLDNYTPRQFASQNDQTIITQYEMHAIEALGLLKIDFLGLKNLTIIQNTIKIIEKTRNIKIDIDKIPLNDKKTYELLQKGNTTGVFQLESAGMKRYLKQLKPTEFENIIAMISLYRPGPMEWIPEYILRKQGKKKVTYLHPKLENALKKTYGVPIYQEQLMQIAQDVAGFTLAEADVLRKAIGKKIKHLLLEQKKKFIQGAVAGGIPEDIAQKIFAFIEPFAGYGFNRSHGACYAMIAYQTAYLKTHYPAEFMAALLTSDQEDIDRVAIEIAECKEMGIEVLPPDVNESFTTFTVVKKDGKQALRFGLNAIKNLGNELAKQIVEERKQNGKFKNFDDFIQRLAGPNFNKKFLESLAKSGALDSLIERNQVLQNMEKILNYSKNIHKTKSQGQVNLFNNLTQQVSFPLHLEKVPPASKWEKLLWERELLGLYVSDHPLTKFKNYLNECALNSQQIKSKRQNEKVVFGGVINKIKKIITKNGETMLFVTIEDMIGKTEIIVFPKVLLKNPTIFQENKIILVKGKISDKDGEIKIICDEAKELTEKLVENWQKTKKADSSLALKITLPPNATPQLLYELKNIFEAAPGSSAIILHIPNGQNSFKIIKAKTKIRIHPTLVEKIQKFVGKKNIEIINQPASVSN